MICAAAQSASGGQRQLRRLGGIRLGDDVWTLRDRPEVANGVHRVLGLVDEAGGEARLWRASRPGAE
ncbi:Chromate resistance protein ChrB [Nonomuraea sp. NPDC005983]|uniref:Chromate resistance protein ChrB n=1 Tax=Nonomuraea sp. NPDC005983 TaxID=3155595 RepID=UPI0033AB86CA